MERICVFDAADVLNHDDYDELSAKWEVSDGSYLRYYPNASWKYVDADLKARLNDTLVGRNGGDASILQERYVLLHFSWFA